MFLLIFKSNMLEFNDSSAAIKIILKCYNPNQLDFRHKSLLKCHVLGTQHGNLDITKHLVPD